MLYTLEVPKDRWGVFLNLLDKLAIDLPVRIEVESMELGDQELTPLMGLRGIELDERGSAAGQLTITVGTGDAEISHRITRPEHMYVGHDNSGAFQWIAFEDAEGGKVFIHFVHPRELEQDAGINFPQ